MLVIWRGFGWSVPIILFASFLITRYFFDSSYEEGYYSSNDWPKTVTLITCSLIIGLLGYYLNYKKRIIVVDDETGNNTKSPSHTFFFIPIQFWAVLIPVLFFWIENYKAEQDTLDLTYIQSPAVNDKYLVDYTILFKGSDEKFKYGVMTISSVSIDTVEFLLSEISYDKSSGPRKDIRDGKTGDSRYFGKEPVIFTKMELLALKNNNAIDSIIRD